MKAVKAKLLEKGKSEAEVADFEKRAGAAAKKIVANFKNYEFYIGESMNPDGMYVVPTLCVDTAVANKTQGCASQLQGGRCYAVLYLLEGRLVRDQGLGLGNPEEGVGYGSIYLCTVMYRGLSPHLKKKVHVHMRQPTWSQLKLHPHGDPFRVMLHACLIAAYAHAPSSSSAGKDHRSEERRVGKECRSRWSQYH